MVDTVSASFPVGLTTVDPQRIIAAIDLGTNSLHMVIVRIEPTLPAFSIIAREKETLLQPSWMNNESSFKSMPFSYVIREFERQYNVTINPQSIDLEQLFTGSFSHENIEMALKSITLPLNVKYNFKNKATIEFTRD